MTVTGLAGSQMLAILWALVPRISKFTSEFVRPDNHKFPYLSYAVFGACSMNWGRVEFIGNLRIDQSRVEFAALERTISI